MTTGDSDGSFRIEAPEAVEEGLRSRPAGDGLAADLPFPVAFAWDRVRKEPTPWNRLFRDGLETVLRYLGVVAASEYLAEEDHTDPGVNDALKPLGRGGPSAGHWLQLVRRCARREPPGRRALPGLEEGWQQVEEERRVRLVWPRRNLDTQPQGLLSTLVTARNHLFGHGVAPEPGERDAAARRLRKLYRLALESLAPVWRHALHLPVPADGGERFLRLRGLQDFAAVEPPASAGTGGWVEGRGGVPVPLYPLALADRPGTGEGTLLGRSAELYLINYLRRSEVPVYMGLRGDVGERPDLADDVSALFERKGVWERRRDLELDQVLAYAAEDKAERSLEYFRRDGLYTPAAHVDRSDLQEELDAFLASGDARLLFVTGRAGTGKTASLARWTERLRDRDAPVLLLRAIELPEREVTSAPRLEEWLCGELGWDGDLAEVLDRAAEREPGRLVIVLEGLNEFADLGRDLDGLWRAVNELAERHAEHEALKVVVSARSEGPRPEAYLPGGDPPARFADPSVYWRSDGEHFLRVEGLSPDESVDALVRRGVGDDRARRAVREHGDALSNPMNVVRFADGILAGDELDEVTAEGLTLSFLERRVSDSPDLQEVLRDLIAVLGEEKSSALTLETIRDEDPDLAEALRPGSGLLDRLRAFELVRAHHVEGSDGRPVPVLSLGDDRLFDTLWRRENRRIRLKTTGNIWLTTLLIIGSVLGFGWGIVRLWLSVRVPEPGAPARSDLRSGLLEAGASAGQASEWAASIVAQYATMTELLREFWLQDLFVWVAAWALAGIALGYGIALLADWITSGIYARRRGSPRIAYYGHQLGKQASESLMRPLLIPLLAGVGYILVQALLHGTEGLAGALTSLAPWIGLWGGGSVLVVFGWLAHRVHADGSPVARRALLAPATVRTETATTLVHLGIMAAVAVAVLGATDAEPRSLPGYDRYVRPASVAVDSSLRSLSAIKEEVVSTTDGDGARAIEDHLPASVESLAEIHDKRTEILSAGIPEGSPVRRALRSLVFWAVGATAGATLLLLATWIAVSRRQYPREWAR